MSRARPLHVQACLERAVEAGTLRQAEADRAYAAVARLLAKGLPESEAVARAADELREAAQRSRRQTALRVIAAERSVDQAASHPRGFDAGVAALFARDAFGLAGYSNVEGRSRAVVAEAHARLAQLLDAYRTKRLGFAQDLPGLRRFVRALYGESGDAEAAGMARAWTETTDGLVARFNRAGGDLAKPDTWRLPQQWNRDKVRAAGEAEFTAFLHREIEGGGLRIVDWDTGEPVAAERAAEIIGRAYQRIRTDGLVDLVPGQVSGPGAVANSRQMRRAFQWQSADAWFRFNDTFGEGDHGIYDLLVGHIEGIARDIGSMEVLGPNPAWTARYLIDTARRDHGVGETRAALLGNIWHHASGAAAVPQAEWLATLGRGVRSWLTSAQLGSAVISAVTDFATLRETAAWNGLASTAVMRRGLSLLNPANAEDRVTAVRLGLVADGWTQRALGASRHQADIVGRDLPGRIAEFVMRVSGMNAHTQAATWAFGMEFSAHLAARAGRALDQLEEPLRRTFARYGITADDWDVLRTRGIYDAGEGATFILPEQIVGQPAGAGRQLPADIAAWRAGSPLPPDIEAAERRATELAALGAVPATPDRLALRAERATAVLERRAANLPGGEPAAERRALIVIGPPSAGKSSLIEPLAYNMRALIIDPDDMKAELPEFEGGLGAMRVHEESSDMAARARRAAISRGVNIAIPTVGADADGVERLLLQLKAEGYRVTLVLNDLPIERAAQRNMARFRETGRLVGHRYLIGIGSRPKETYLKLRDAADEHAHYSNDVARGQAPVHLGGQRLAILSDADAGRAAASQSGRGGPRADEPRAGAIGGRAQGDVDPGELDRRQQAASRYLEMVNTEAQFAVPQPGALDRAILLGGSRAGTVGGEFRRSMAQYKSFPITMMSRHLMRGIEGIRGGDHGRYLAALTIGLTAMGALAMQAKEVARGRDPRAMDDARFWGAAFLQGGGAGIVGDFLYAGLSRADQSFFMTAIGGPTGGLVDDVMRLTGANITATAEGRDSNFGRELARFVQRNTPGASLWYGRLAMDRLLWDRLQEQLDPHAARRWREIERRAFRDFEQEFWWSPGQPDPARAPDLAAALGNALGGP